MLLSFVRLQTAEATCHTSYENSSLNTQTVLNIQYLKVQSQMVSRSHWDRDPAGGFTTYCELLRCGIRPGLWLLSVHLRAALSIQENKSWERTAFLAPNFIPRNSDLPRLELVCDWLTARSACHICMKQLYTHGAGLLKETVTLFRDNVLFLSGWRPAVGDNDYLLIWIWTTPACMIRHLTREL